MQDYRANVSAPRQQTPGNAEMFVGLNVLSKIGVIFIIIGFIAFAAVSEDYIPPLGRTVMVFAMGIVMAVLGEVFYRKKSHVFARALTLGGIFDCSLCVLIAYYSFYSINDIAATLIGAAAAAGGLALGWRYNSQTVTITALVCAVLPFFVAADDMGCIFAGMAAALAVQTAAAVIAYIKGWKAINWVGMGCSFVLSVSAWAASLDIHSWSDTMKSVISSVFTLVLFAVYIASSVKEGADNGGVLSGNELAKLITPIIVSVLTAAAFMGAASKTGAGILLAVIALLCIIIAAALRIRFGRCNLFSVFEISALVLIPLSLLFLFTLRWVMIAITCYGAALILAELFFDRKMYRIPGIIALVLGELLFLFGGLSHIKLTIFPLQYAVNVLAFLSIMVCFALKKRTGTGLSVFSAAAIINTGFFGVYLILDKLIPAIDKAAVLTSSEEEMFGAMFCTVLWFAVAFVSGKLGFMGKGAAVTSICIYVVGLLCLFSGNISSGFISHEGLLTAVVIILVNVISVAAVLDIVKRAETLANRTMQSLALFVSTYALFTMTIMLNNNDWLAFTSCIISIIYILTAVCWIVLGFAKNKPLTRRFGLALTLLASGKLFLFDFSGLNDMVRTLMFIGFGITMLAISCVYGYFEKKAKLENSSTNNQR